MIVPTQILYNRNIAIILTKYKIHKLNTGE